MPKPVRLVLEAWRGVTFRQPFAIVASGEVVDPSGWDLALKVWDPQGAPTAPLVELGQDTDTGVSRIEMSTDPELAGDLIILSDDLDLVPVGSRPESRQPVTARIAFVVTPPGGEATYYGLGDLRVYPQWGVDALPGATTATGAQVVLDVTANTITYDLGGGEYVAAAAAAVEAAEGWTDLAKDWAQKTGAAVTAALYSAKEWAVGTFIRGAAGGGSAKDWAIYNGGTVDNADWSARAHAVGAAPTGSAKDWSTKTASEVVAGQGYGAKKYAMDAATSEDNADASATLAQNAAAAILGSAVNTSSALLDLTPEEVTATTYTITDADAGKLLAFSAATRVIVYVDSLAAAFVCGIMKVGAGDVEVWPGLAGAAAPDALLTLTTQYASAILRQIFDDVHVLQGGEAALPDLGINRYLFNQAASTGLLNPVVI